MAATGCSTNNLFITTYMEKGSVGILRVQFKLQKPLPPPGGDKTDAHALEAYEDQMEAYQIKQSKAHTIY
jgi:hypothetical protein